MYVTAFDEPMTYQIRKKDDGSDRWEVRYVLVTGVMTKLGGPNDFASEEEARLFIARHKAGEFAWKEVP